MLNNPAWNPSDELVDGIVDWLLLVCELTDGDCTRVDARKNLLVAGRKFLRQADK